MAVNRQAKSRQKRFGIALASGLAILVVSYFPSYHWGNPKISLVASAAVASLLAMRYTSVRQGWIRGIVLGLLAGMGSLTGMHNGIVRYVQWRESGRQAESAPESPEAGESTAESAKDAAAETALFVGDSEPAEAESAEATEPAPESDMAAAEESQQPPPPDPLTEEEWQQINALRRNLPVMCLAPNFLLCLLVSVIFSQLAVKRRQRRQPRW
ncbi:MAG: hypothetical protein ACYS8X_09930 [Planctomycetota bacterium]|jgi:hypothetical protein